MKLVFCTSQIIGSGGVERVLSKRLNYFVENFNYDITVITTENNSKNFQNKNTFFYFNPKIKNIDLGIKYSEFYKEIRNLTFIQRKIRAKKLKQKHLKFLN